MQAAFLLDQPVLFADSRQAELYDQVKRQIFAAAKSDHTSARSNLFRVPGCMNNKPDCEPVRGELVSYEPDRRYSLEELQAAFPPAPNTTKRQKRRKPSTVKSDEIDQLIYDEALELAGANGIERDDAAALLQKLPDNTDRSATFYRSVTALTELDLAPKIIAKLLSANPSLWEKYGGRFLNETERVIAKQEEEGSVPIAVNPVTEVALSKAAPLSEDIATPLDVLCNTLNVGAKRNRIIDFARIAMTILNKHEIGAVSAPPGTGKTLSMIAYAAATASITDPIMIVVPTRAEVRDICTQINLLRPDAAGIILGWTSNECCKSSKNTRFASKRRKLCPECTQTATCDYYNSPAALKLPIVVTTHASFMVLIGSRPLTMTRFKVICDEDLNNFTAEFFSGAELKRLYGLVAPMTGGGELLKQAFPMISWNDAVLTITNSLDVTVLALAQLSTPLLRNLRRYLYAHAETLDDSMLDLLARFTFFFDNRHGGQWAVCTVDGGVKLKRLRIDLRRLTVKRFHILDATALFSLTDNAAGVPIYTCPQLNTMTVMPKAKLCIVVGNPTKTSRTRHASYLKQFLPHLQGHKILMVENKDCHGFTEDLKRLLASDEYSSVTEISRGLLRGSNNYRDCTAFVSVGAGFCDGASDMALTAALLRGETIHGTEIWAADGRPLMHRRQFKCREIQNVFAKQYLAILFQGLWRTALRDGRDVVAVVALPDVTWLAELRRLMPLTLLEVTNDAAQMIKVNGLFKLLDTPAGKPISKQEAARMLGYRSFKRNKDKIKLLLDGFFKIGSRCFKRQN